MTDPLFNNKVKTLVPPGIYYLVLIDLCGSTNFAREHGNIALMDRISAFKSAAETALERSKPDNFGVLAAKVGDALLLLFNYFPDIVRWWAEFEGALDVECTEHVPLKVRACVHIGETFHIDNDFTCLAINQVFKMEAKKSIPLNFLIVTDIAKAIAEPSLLKNQVDFKELSQEIEIPGISNRVKLHQVQMKQEIAFLIQTTNPHYNPFRKP